MIITNRRRYKRQYAIGGAGIFDSIASFFKRLLATNATKQITQTAFSAAKNAAQEIGKKAIDVGKTVATDAEKQLVDKASEKIFTPKNQENITKLTGLKAQSEGITQKSKDILDRIINHGATNINNILAGSGAIKIEDLVRRLNGGGMKKI